MLSKFKLNFILYSVFALLIYVSQPGTYYIINIDSSAGQRLAATFQGPPNAVVTPMINSISQRVWLDSSCYILLFVLLNFVVDDCPSYPQNAIDSTCFGPVQSSNRKWWRCGRPSKGWYRLWVDNQSKPWWNYFVSVFSSMDGKMLTMFSFNLFQYWRRV